MNQGAETFTQSGDDSKKYYCEVTVKGNSCFEEVTKQIVKMDNERSFEIDAPKLGGGGRSTVVEITFYECCNSCSTADYISRAMYTAKVKDFSANGLYGAWLSYASNSRCN